MALDIPAEFTDVDFTKFPQYVAGDNGMAALRGYKQFELEYADVVLTEAEMRAAIEKLEADNTGSEWLVKEIKNQRNEGSCVGNMGTGGLQLISAQQVGVENTPVLSAMSVYRNIGSSPNSGAMVSDCLDFISEFGALPQDTPENVAQFGADVCTPATGWSTIGRQNTWSAKRNQVAGQFRLLEWTVFRTYEGVISALLNGWFVGVGRAGHSIILVRPAIRNGSIGAVYANSWSTDFGFAAGNMPGGFGFDSKSVASNYGWAFGMRAMVAR